MKMGDVVLIQYKNKSKSGEYKLGRVIKVEVDVDGLVRTCIVRYSLIQHLAEKEKMVYKGVTKKYIRVAIQRLVLILPVEEQVDLKAVGADEVAEAEEIVGMKEEVKRVPTNASKKSFIAAHSLKCITKIEQLQSSITWDKHICCVSKISIHLNSIVPNASPQG